MDNQILTILLEFIRTTGEEAKKEKLQLAECFREKEKYLQEERAKNQEYQREMTRQTQSLQSAVAVGYNESRDEIAAEQILSARYRFALEILSQFELSDDAHAVIKKALNSDSPPKA